MGRKCKKSTVYCGTKLASDCVDYIGDELKSLDKSIDQCDLSVTDAIEHIDSEIKKVKDGLDTKKLVRLCIDSIDKEDTVVIVINKLISEICKLSEQVKDLESKQSELDVLSAIVNLDSTCLTDTHCSTDSTLKSLLMKIIAELCFLKSQVNNSGNSSNVYQP